MNFIGVELLFYMDYLATWESEFEQLEKNFSARAQFVPLGFGADMANNSKLSDANTFTSSSNADGVGIKENIYDGCNFQNSPRGFS